MLINAIYNKTTMANKCNFKLVGLWLFRRRTLLFLTALSFLICKPAFSAEPIMPIQTILGEARGESFEGQIAVAEVIRNRANNPSWWGNNPDSVCLKKFQFSFWNDKKLARKTLSKISGEVYQVASRAWFESENSNLTKGATHYCRYDSYPFWRSKLKFICRIGDHLFFK